MTMRSFAEHGKVVNLVSPVNLADGDNQKFASMRNYQGSFLYVACGALADTSTLIVRQAKNVAGSGIKDLAFSKYFRNLTTSSPTEEEDLWIEEDNSASAVLTLVASTNYIIPIRPGMLDVTNDFDCVGITIIDPGIGSNLSHVALFLHDGSMGIAGNTKHIPGAVVNQMPN